MEQFKSPLETGGIPLITNDFVNSESEGYKVMLAMCAGQSTRRTNIQNGAGFSGADNPFVDFVTSNNDAFVLGGGGASSFSDPTYVDFAQTGTYGVAEGWVYFGSEQGGTPEICKYLGEEGRSPIASGSGLFLIRDTPTYKNRLTQNGILRQVRKTTNAVITELPLSSPPVGVEYCHLDGSCAYWNSQSISGYQAKNDQEIFNNTISISNVSQTHINDKVKQTTNLSLTTPGDWSIVSPHSIILTKYPNATGFITLTAVISHTNSTNSTIFTIPSGWRPSVNGSNFSHICHTNDTTVNSGYIQISSGGLVTAPALSSGQTITINTQWSI